MRTPTQPNPSGFKGCARKRITLATALALSLLAGAAQSPVQSVLQGEAATAQLREQGRCQPLGQAMQAARYAVETVPNGSAAGEGGECCAGNPAHGLRYWLRGDGLELQPAGATRWKLNLRLLGYGRAALERAEVGEVSARQNRVEVSRADGAVVEWYENQPAGLEQGFTLLRRPQGQGPLRLVLEAGGDLRPELEPEAGSTGAANPQAWERACAVKFVAPDGEAALRYSGLKAWDAAQRELTAHLEVQGRQLALVVNDRDATYPVTIDPLITDSVDDWSFTQGYRGWSYGYYNRTADANAVYDASTDFNSTDPNWQRVGSSWELVLPGDPPWTSIGQTEWHPNGENNTEVHWAIRRWVSTVDDDVSVRLQFGKVNIGGGTGTTLRVFLNGQEKFARTVAFDDGAGFDTYVVLTNLQSGDLLDFALDPLGTDGSRADGADGSRFRGTVSTEPPPPLAITTQPGSQDVAVGQSATFRVAAAGAEPFSYQWFFNGASLPGATAASYTINSARATDSGNYTVVVTNISGSVTSSIAKLTVFTGLFITDSVDDWSPNGTQGYRGWSYGYYNRTADGAGVYDPSSDFNSTDPNWWWDGGEWRLGPLNPSGPPWTSIGQTDWHPNGENSGSVHWAIRRWVSTVDDDVSVRLQFGKTNIGGGDGTTLRVFLNGQEKFARTVAGDDGAGFDAYLILCNLQSGDLLDFALDPFGTDSCDQSRFRATVRTRNIAQDIDVGLRMFDGTVTNRIACETPGPGGLLLSPLRIAKNGTNYGIVLVETNAPGATKIHVQTSSGIKAWKKLTNNVP